MVSFNVPYLENGWSKPNKLYHFLIVLNLLFQLHQFIFCQNIATRCWRQQNILKNALFDPLNPNISATKLRIRVNNPIFLIYSSSSFHPFNQFSHLVTFKMPLSKGTFKLWWSALCKGLWVTCHFSFLLTQGFTFLRPWEFQKCIDISVTKCYSLHWISKRERKRPK